MKNFLIPTFLFLGLSAGAFAQKHPPRPPVPPHPSRSQLYNDKARELDKKYNTEKRMILNHPLATKKMKNDQLKALNLRYQNEKRLLKATR
ncbi:hypothetical protein QF023_000378 [Chryseobacterium sp. SLBN-27]|jgi:hypothetical protein|uniref:hypothetical protein n=1 Tax=Chryseobacterium sp. SLBN-27 TaxID=3042287 RepID=UPI00285E4D32|nr:hypothetical protein [Chryseobacterium sp. SLBN-27]MDR6156862.1 hypothetical protein [Chryseobacterium sp. SLBN-27]